MRKVQQKFKFNWSFFCRMAVHDSAHYTASCVKVIDSIIGHEILLSGILLLAHLTHVDFPFGFKARHQVQTRRTKERRESNFFQIYVWLRRLTRSARITPCFLQLLSGTDLDATGQWESITPERCVVMYILLLIITMHLKSNLLKSALNLTVSFVTVSH